MIGQVRKQFGRPLSETQHNQFGLARMATQVSCDWWTVGHVTSCPPLIGPGGGRQGHGEERGAGPGLAAPGHRAALLHGQALRHRQLLRGHSYETPKLQVDFIF